MWCAAYASLAAASWSSARPGAMCAMALMPARFKRVVFAATAPKAGVAGSVLELFAFAERSAPIKSLRDERNAQAAHQALHGMDVGATSPP